MKGHHNKILRKKALRVGKAEGIPAFPLTDWLIADYTGFPPHFLG
jgi:hypothetical protein